MTPTRFLAAACAASITLTAAAFAGGEGWTQDYAAAKKEATEGKKDLLLDFTGSDWCPPCIALSKNILSKPEFREATKDNFVLVELDYPREKELPEETKKQNEELQGKYSIEGYPTVFLCDASGRPYAQTGFQDGGPDEYVKHLDELREQKTARDKAFADAEKAEGVAKAKALVSALDAMSINDGAVAEFYPDVVTSIKAADPKDESGFASRIESKKKFEDFQKGLQELGMKQDHDGALAYVEKAEADFEGEQKQQVVAIKGMILAELKRFDDALKALDQAKEIAPESEIAGQIDAVKGQIESAKENAAKGEGTEEKDAE